MQIIFKVFWEYLIHHYDVSTWMEHLSFRIKCQKMREKRNDVWKWKWANSCCKCYFAIFFPAVYTFVVVFCIAFWDEALSKTWEEIAVGNNSILEHDFERSREADDALNWYARAFFKIYTMNPNNYFLNFELNSN